MTISRTLACMLLSLSSACRGDLPRAEAASASPDAGVASLAADYETLARAYRHGPAHLGWVGQNMAGQMEHMGRGTHTGPAELTQGPMGGAPHGAVAMAPETLRAWHEGMARWHGSQTGGLDSAWHQQMAARHRAMADTWSFDGTATPAGLDGAALYQRTCAACHGSDGRGVAGAFPPLARSPIVDDVDLLSRIVLHGLQGSLVVNGKRVTGVMPGVAAQLNDEAVAALLTTVRASWGNTGSAVSASDVARVRGQDATHVGPWDVSDFGLGDDGPADDDDAGDALTTLAAP